MSRAAATKTELDSLTFLVPGRLDTLTGGYGYDRRIIDGLRANGWSVLVSELDASFPNPTALALNDAARRFAEISDGGVAVVDGLAFGRMSRELEREAGRLRLLPIVHHPLAAESGLDPETAADYEAGERRALATARAVIVTSRGTAQALDHYGVARDRIHVVEPGTDPAPIARGSGGAIVRLLTVATLIPRKGHDALIRALDRVPQRNWTLTAVGSLDRHPPTVERLRELLHVCELDDRVLLAGEMEGDALAAQYDRADVFVLPTLYEGYGMAVAEAIAHGLPVVSTATGAIAEIVQSNGEAGLLVEPDNVPQLSAALSAVIGDAALRSRLAAGARAARVRLSTWEQASTRFAEVVRRVQR